MSRKSKKKAWPTGKTSKGAELHLTELQIRPAIAGNRWTILAVCVFLASVVWIVFGQTWRYDFINYDDNVYVYEDAAVTHGLTLKGIAAAFNYRDTDNWVPLTTISHMLDCQLYGLNAGGHHLTNVLLHAATAILLFLVLRQMTGFLWRSALVAALFAVHPLGVESVAWVSERKDVLSGLFFMLTLWTYGVYARRQGGGSGGIFSCLLSPFYWLTLLFFALGLLSKPMLVTLPFILLLLDYWPLNRISLCITGAPHSLFHTLLRLTSEKIPFLALTAASCIATVLAQSDATASFQAFGFLARIGNALASYVAYLYQMIYPVGLAAFYSHPGNHLSVWTAGLSALVLIVISVSAIKE